MKAGWDRLVHEAAKGTEQTKKRMYHPGGKADRLAEINSRKKGGRGKGKDIQIAGMPVK